ncbi:hypothetical protein [Stutzerimonas kunmingensis]|uniref:hypothetical protein n=1 Tax=Stutzerimonas kunmingensis TaxID=1211807 RepID=UPI00289D6484|nr:hypothetical protein [Stutzerimonas kunmingensis]
MSKCYRPGELKAGKTFFMYTLHGPRLNHVEVSEYIIGGKKDRLPEVGELHPYRVNPAELSCLCLPRPYRTRKAAMKAGIESVRRLNW